MSTVDGDRRPAGSDRTIYIVVGVVRRWSLLGHRACSPSASGKSTAAGRPRRPTSSSPRSRRRARTAPSKEPGRAGARRRRGCGLRRPDTARCSQATLLGQLTNGAAGPGMRPVIADSRVVQGQLLVMQDLLPRRARRTFQEFVDSLKLVTTTVGGLKVRGPARSGWTALMPRAREELAELVAIPVGRRPAAVPAGGVRPGRRVGAGRLRRGRASPTPASSRRPTAARPSSGRGPSPTPTRPTVLLYAHYDVQPPLDEEAWRTPPFELTEVDGRWYGRGTADCKGNIVMHLTALRALGDDVPVNLKLVVEGSEEQGTGGLEAFVPEHADLLRADAILVCDTGNAAVGAPGRHREPARHGQRRRDGRGARRRSCTRACSAAPRPTRWPRSIAMLATLRDERGQHHDRRASTTPRPGPASPTRRTSSAATPGRRRRRAARRRHASSDMLWARPAVTDPGHRLPARRRVGGGDRAARRAPGSTCGSRPAPSPRRPRRR